MFLFIDVDGKYPPTLYYLFSFFVIPDSDSVTNASLSFPK